MHTVRTQVGIIGAGPAGLLLSQLLAKHGIESVVLETKSRDYIEKRVRAGVLEQGTVDLLRGCGVAERLEREGLVHHGIELRFDGQRQRIAFEELVPGRAITIYGQQEVVKDLIAARIAGGGTTHFEVSDVRPLGFATDSPSIEWTEHGEPGRLQCDFIAGCDGFHGVSREAIPAGVLRTFERTYPFAWLGILARVAPSADELIYAYNERGFALLSMRSPQITRLYLQVAADEQIERWSDDAIWAELHRRLETVPGWQLHEGPVIEKNIAQMRSFVVEPMQYERLFLAGDAAHIVPPTGAKGLNLAAADVRVLTSGLAHFYATGSQELLERYSSQCLRRVWRAQHFSFWMTSLLHTFDHDDAYAKKLQLSNLHYVASSRAAAMGLAENYVGLELSGA
jgi:p-hydroxybenzoate 3-monooxygenase